MNQYGNYYRNKENNYVVMGAICIKFTPNIDDDRLYG